jgi:hypothetical protein
MAIIGRLEPARTGKFVFPGRFNVKPIDHGPVWELVQKLTGREIGQPVVASPHGFRSSFRSWCTAKKVSVAVAERCLAHELKSAVEQAYDREELLDPRRDVMERWAKFLSGADATTSCRCGERDAMPAINLTDDELAAVTSAIRRTIEHDRFPHAPRLDPVRAALGSTRRRQSLPRSRRLRRQPRTSDKQSQRTEPKRACRQ